FRRWVHRHRTLGFEAAGLPRPAEETMEYSTSPDGERFPLPGPSDYSREFARLEALVAAERDAGRQIVVVVGGGFVGAVMAGVIADSTDRRSGRPGKFVIGMQRPSVRSYWKIPLLGRGIAPVSAEDPEVAPMIARCVQEKKTLVATFTEEALKLADVAVVDVQCDYLKESLGDLRTGHADMAALEKSME